MSEDIKYYKVNHRYKDRIIVPLMAVTKSIDFIVKDEEKYVITADNVKCKVKFLWIRNIFDIQEEIQKMYQLSAWDFLSRWHSVYVNLTNIDFFVMGLEKVTE